MYGSLQSLYGKSLKGWYFINTFIWRFLFINAYLSHVSASKSIFKNNTATAGGGAIWTNLGSGITVIGR